MTPADRWFARGSAEEGLHAAAAMPPKSGLSLARKPSNEKESLQ